LAVAIVVAAGRGERLGTALPKAFVPVGGRPMVEWGVEAASAVARAVVVALPPGAAPPAGAVGVEGGPTRSHSVRNALAAVPPGDDPVVVHDAARPLAGTELFRRVLAALGESDAAIAAAPLADTVKEADAAGRVTRTLDRARLWAVQTPQAFRRAVLERALAVPEEVLSIATDDAWLVERVGGTVQIVPSSRENLKVTTPFDLRLAESLVC
jgi:2-C-methyl-D-erythritol 4-phosphate cytidylyltransferase